MKVVAWLFGGFVFSVVAVVLIGLTTLHMHLNILGADLIVVGLLCGRSRQVIYVQEWAPSP